MPADSQYQRDPQLINSSCSIACYKPHKSTHEDITPKSSAETSTQQLQSKIDRPGTTQRAPKLDFTGFENDKDFQHLLTRFPNLKHQLQLVYGVTLEPGPDDAGRWNRQNWFPDDRDGNRGGFQDRGRGRGRGRGGGTGPGRGGYLFSEIPPQDRLKQPWNQEKGDKQGADILSRMRNSANDEHAEGMDEFIQLCQIKFGK